MWNYSSAVCACGNLWMYRKTICHHAAHTYRHRSWHIRHGCDGKSALHMWRYAKLECGIVKVSFVHMFSSWWPEVQMFHHNKIVMQILIRAPEDAEHALSDAAWASGSSSLWEKERLPGQGGAAGGQRPSWLHRSMGSRTNEGGTRQGVEERRELLACERTTDLCCKAQDATTIEMQQLKTLPADARPV